ncbi:MAG: serine/threonine-protein phosphatase [Desulfobulbaceae bacterium]|nr:serine/threonine-protein phosphatase [Desulfobulbaceae bacterium]
MKKSKMNCWKYKECGRQPGGNKAEKDGVCPAAAEKTFHMFNNGLNGGRACWLIAGTFCDQKISGTYAEKIDTCKSCGFYKMVQEEEHSFKLIEDNFSFYATTHVGLVRKSNEDRYLIKKFKDETILFAVADGMGGQAAGDYAAEIVRGKMANLSCILRGKETDVLSSLAVETDKILIELGEKDEQLEGLGTTLLCVFVRDNTAFWVHVGDSRLTIYRGEKLLQITKDQNLARYLVEEGEISLEEVADHYSRNILDQALGNAMEEPETGMVPLEVGDTLLLTTDGFHNPVLPKIIAAELRKTEDLKKTADCLVNYALAKGGTDNITIVIAQYTGP